MLSLILLAEKTFVTVPVKSPLPQCNMAYISSPSSSPGGGGAIELEEVYLFRTHRCPWIDHSDYWPATDLL